MNSLQTLGLRALLAAGVLLSALAAPAPALTIATWTGTTGDWTDPTNWNSNPFYPDNGQNSDTWNAVITNGGTVTLDSNIAIQALTLNNGTITNSGNTLTANATVNLGPGANAFLTGSGTLDALAGVAFRSNGGNNPATRNAWTINLHANSNFITGSGWNMENTGTINILPGVTFDLQGHSSSGGNITGSGGIINNQGVFQRTTNSPAVSISSQFNNMAGGQVHVVSGNLSLNSGGTHGGSFDIAAGRSLALMGTHALNSGASITGAGSLAAGNVTFHDGSSVNIGGSLTIATIPNFNSSTPTLVGGNMILTGSGNGFGGSGDIVVNGIFNWNAPGGNTVGGSGKLTVMGGLQLFNSNGGDVINKVLDLHGTSFIESNNGWTVTNNGTINVKSGSFDYRSRDNVTSARLLGSGTINNEGLFFRSETSIAGRIDNTFNNIGGTLRADAGTTLNLMGPFSQTAGTTLINGGTLSIAGTANFSGGQIAGGDGGTLIANVDATGAGTGLTISPGQSTGQFDIVGNVTLDGNDTIRIELGGVGKGLSSSGYDFLNVNGTLNLGGSTLELSFLNGFKPSASDIFEIIEATSLVGVFSNVAPGSNALSGTLFFEATYAGNSLVLSNFIQVPEPGSFVLAAGLALAGSLTGRRRHGSRQA